MVELQQMQKKAHGNSGWWKMQTLVQRLVWNSSGLGLYNSKADADGVERFLFSLATNNRINGGFRGAGGSPDTIQ